MNNNLLNIKTPAENVALELSSDYTLKNHGMTNLRQVFWNLPTESLYEEAIFRGEASISKMGALVVNSGSHTARAAQDKFVVREASTEENIWWGEYNRPISPEKFDNLYTRMLGYLQGRDLFVQDCYAGADEEFRMPVRIITELAWHSHFARNMFILPTNREEYRQHVPDFTVISIPSYKAHEPIDGTHSGTFIILNFEQRLAIIGGTQYGGEIKKSIFTVMNYLLPLKGVMTMHCSANASIFGVWLAGTPSKTGLPP